MPLGSSDLERRTSSLKYELPPSMMMSPDSSSCASCSTVFSVGPPAGTMIQTARGWARSLTSSASEAAPLAPSFSSAATFAGFKSVTTQSCPPRIRRRTMFAPILPSPTMPSCIVRSPSSPTSATTEQMGTPPHLLKSLVDRRLEPRQATAGIGEMHAQGTTLALEQHAEVATRLRGLHDAERVPLAGDLHVVLVLGSDLQKNARVGAALVGLSGGMEETR